MNASEILLGQTLVFDGNPFIEGWQSARHDARGAVLLRNGRIESVGTGDDLRRDHPKATVTDYGNALILPGFVDAHVHYPQTAIIASWGKRLIDWLNTYTFPEEMRFEDKAYARECAARYFDLTLAAGTTTVASYCTIHPESVEAFFEEAQARGVAGVAGKTCMDRNAPDGLRDTVQSSYDDSKRLLEHWDGVDRLRYAITPRFSPTSTREQLEALGGLWGEHPECLMQTHLSEQVEEIAWVAELFPEARDYLDTYEAAGLLGTNGLYGHAIHLTARERARLKDVGAATIHCPTSNMFIGSGLYDLKGLAVEAHRIGLATDTGGGSSFSMLRTMAAAYEVAQLNGYACHPAELLWLATTGSSEALGLGHRIGALKPGYDGDLVVLDLTSTTAIAQRSDRANDIWEAVFPTIMMGDDRAIRDVRVMGKAAI